MLLQLFPKDVGIPVMKTEFSVDCAKSGGTRTALSPMLLGKELPTADKQLFEVFLVSVRAEHKTGPDPLKVVENGTCTHIRS
ncbi:hypothetical protein AVEN_250378-1 [Araneus ventricosus]|uniref:Uncharacterized protein n=1 Tax=Araneus ventricosus TaxID=182803 RepID=A0A4Y2QFY0_ARAVE|nr:hypothetical protein AVEN_250378-1 [Araneus ventricosus]